MSGLGERFALEEAEALVAAAVASAGCSNAVAASVARALVAAEAEGQVGHGFSRLEDYVAQARSGKIVADAAPQVEMAGTASVVVDAAHGFAYPALDLARDRGIAVAAGHGVASVSVRRSHHCGALSVQVAALAEAGFVAMMVANTPAAMAPWGAAKPVFGTNPIAFAAPRTSGVPLVIDLSLSVVARGKVMHAKKTGGKIPEGWALDADGAPTTDPDAALAGSMMPIGGPKGTALALVVEILAATFTASTPSAEAASFFNPDGPPPGVGQFLMVLKPADGAAFTDRLDALLGMIEDAPGARLPGQRRAAALAKARSEGIWVPQAYADAARRLAGG